MLKWAMPWIAIILTSLGESGASTPILIETGCRASPRGGPLALSARKQAAAQSLPNSQHHASGDTLSAFGAVPSGGQEPIMMPTIIVGTILVERPAKPRLTPWCGIPGGFR